MKSGTDSNAVSGWAFFPVGMAAAIIAVVIVCIVGNIAGCDPAQDQDDTVLLVRDYPIFEQRTAHSEPLSMAQATQQAWEWVMTGTNSGEYHYYGYARGILDPWWDQNNVSSELRILRAVILQQQHFFDQALADLNQVIDSDPQNVQARFTRSAILFATGKLDAALLDCQRVFLKADPISVTLCVAPIKGLQGHAPVMIDKLNTLLAVSELASLQQREVHITLAELYWLQGNMAGAEKQFKQALNITPQHGYVVSQYSEFLLSLKRYNTLANFLQQQPPSIENQINLYYAQKEQSKPELSELKNTITENITTLTNTGDQKPALDNSRLLSLYHSRVENDSRAALLYARKNWDRQKGMIDTLLLMNAATKERDIRTIDKVSQWLEENLVQDQRLANYGAIDSE